MLFMGLDAYNWFQNRLDQKSANPHDVAPLNELL